MVITLKLYARGTSSEASTARAAQQTHAGRARQSHLVWSRMLTGVDKVPLLGRGDAREPDAGR